MRRKQLFTRRENQIIKLIFRELSRNQISKMLFISPKTVDRHTENIKKKIGAKSFVGMLTYLFKNELMNAESK